MNTSATELAPKLAALLAHVRELAAASPSLQALEAGIVESIAAALPYCNWTGFYMLDPANAEILAVGPYVGDPTPHVRIPIQEGICGAAASGQTVIVDDVNADPRYLSCSIQTKSEIVVPIYAHGRVIGEIDIDSHTPAAFGEGDRVLLEEIARIVGEYAESHSALQP